MVLGKPYILGTGAMTPFRGNYDTTSLLVVFICRGIKDRIDLLGRDVQIFLWLI